MISHTSANIEKNVHFFFNQFQAVIAGKISVHQLKFALRLGDTPVVIRCCLYYSLSLIQQGELSAAKQVGTFGYTFKK